MSNIILASVTITVPSFVTLLRNYLALLERTLHLSEEILSLTPTIHAEMFQGNWNNYSSVGIEYRALRHFGDAQDIEYSRMTNIGVGISYYRAHEVISYGVLLLEWKNRYRNANGFGYLPYRRKAGHEIGVDIDFNVAERKSLDEIPEDLGAEAAKLMTDVMQLMQASTPTVVAWDEDGCIAAVGENAKGMILDIFTTLRSDFVWAPEKQVLEFTSER